MLLRVSLTALIATQLISCTAQHVTEFSNSVTEGTRAYQSGDPTQVMQYQLKAMDNSTETDCTPPDPECTEE